jgi:enterochelin esterase-like enzyme
MLGPDSRLLTALLILASVALLVGAIRLRLLPVKILCGALSIVVAMTGGIAAVNYYYGYYTSWGALWADFHGTSGNLGVITSATTSTVGSGSIGWTSLPGKLSGYNRRALVYLPPQYGRAQYAKVRFPVVELFHGTPGTPLTWNTELHISQVMNSLVSKHLIGPMVVVMPSINGSGHSYQDCVNGPSVNDDTYLTTDVRNDVFAHYRVSHDPYEWAVAGYSSGGYCAANLALRHRTSFGAAAVIEGYFRATDGPAASVLNHSQFLEAANSPLYLAERLTAASSPIPAFWVAAGTNDKADYKPATVFAAALDRIEQVPFYKLNAGDTANAWAAALPAALAWLWQQLAPSDLRVLFPVHSQAGNLTTLPVQPAKGHPACKSAMRPGYVPCSTPAPAHHSGTGSSHSGNSIVTSVTSTHGVLRQIPRNRAAEPAARQNAHSGHFPAECARRAGNCGLLPGAWAVR